MCHAIQGPKSFGLYCMELHKVNKPYWKVEHSHTHWNNTRPLASTCFTHKPYAPPPTHLRPNRAQMKHVISSKRFLRVLKNLALDTWETKETLLQLTYKSHHWEASKAWVETLHARVYNWDEASYEDVEMARKHDQCFKFYPFSFLEKKNKL